jgi:hypothetical protein
VECRALGGIFSGGWASKIEIPVLYGTAQILQKRAVEIYDPCSLSLHVSDPNDVN